MRKLNALPIVSALLLAALLLSPALSPVHAQGLNIPSRNWGLSFGNSTKFNGIRFNIIDKDIERINGINISAWGHKDSERQTGTVNGISIGLPASFGCENLNGLSIGIVGAGAKNDIKGINLGLLASGTGNDAVGLNFGALGTGAGNNMTGINVGGLGAGAGGDLKGINIGGLGAGAGGDLKGINIGGLGAGAGGDLKGINIGGLGIGAGGDVTGINLACLGVGAGEHLRGISIAGLGVGAPEITGLQVTLACGGNQVRGITIAPAYFRIEAEEGACMKGLSVSAFNHIMGDQFGVAIGIFNYAYAVHGFQLGVLNHVRNNPRGLRWLPVFNTSF
jgi:hypothetical protein